MILRWVASALDDASGRFRKLRGHGEMSTLLNALEQRAPDGQIEASRRVA